MTKTCKHCGNDYLTDDRMQQYCSPKCGYAAPARRKKLSIGQHRVGLRMRAQRYEQDIKAAGFWVTPELVNLCEAIYQRGRKATDGYARLERRRGSPSVDLGRSHV